MSGLQNILKNIERIEKDLERQQMQALKNEAERIKLDSNEHYAPQDEGDLIAESYVSKPVKDNERTISIEIGYGGPKSNPYSVALHEHPSASSPPTWNGKELKFTKPGTGPKYLERPLFKAVDGMIDRFAADIKIE